MLERAKSPFMALRLDGKQLAAELEDRLRRSIAAGTERAGRPPGLAVLRVGDDPASGVYVANKEKACARIGVASYGSHLPGSSTQDDVLAAIAALVLDLVGFHAPPENSLISIPWLTNAGRCTKDVD